jgi:hypothetical protein
MLGLIDFDIIAYAKAYSNEDADSEEQVLEDVDNFINFLNIRLQLDDYKGFLTGDGNYREEMATIQPYKGNRDQEKPYWHQTIKDYLIDSHAGVVVDGIEADDAMGIESQQVEDSIIITIDKDLNMIPGDHYKWEVRNTPEKLYSVSPEEADNFFYEQILTGDPGDHIPGLKRCTGRVASKKIKTSLREADNKHEKLFEIWYAAHMDALVKIGIDLPDESVIKGRCIEEINEVGGLLWIQREKDKIWTLEI